VIDSKALAEFFGTATLLLAVVGSSFMAERLTQDSALALFINATATAAVLALIIRSAVNLSGAHFNPLVTLTALLLGKIKALEALVYLIAQVLGAIFGVILANLMFDEVAFSSSSIQRDGVAQLLGEVIATTGLVFIAFSARKKHVWKLIPLWIFGAYFFTVSTSFANPAVTLARFFTEAPAGIAGSSLLGFIAAQLLGALLVLAVLRNRERISR
jgi:glycerol uptake facilitator-like aquaporin